MYVPTHELTSLCTIYPASTWGENLNLLLSTALLSLCSSRQIYHCNIVTKTGNIIFVVHSVRNLRHRQAVRAFPPTGLKEPGQEVADEIWMHLSQWKFSSWLPRTNPHCTTCGGSVHTVPTPLFVFWGLQVCPAYSGSETIPCESFSSVLWNSKFHLAVEQLWVLAHLLLKLRLQKFFAYLSKHQVWVQFFFVLRWNTLFMKIPDSFKPKWRPRGVSNRIMIYIKKKRHFSFDCTHLKKVHQPPDWRWYWWCTCFH